MNIKCMRVRILCLLMMLCSLIDTNAQFISTSKFCPTFPIHPGQAKRSIIAYTSVGENVFLCSFQDRGNGQPYEYYWRSEDAGFNWTELSQGNYNGFSFFRVNRHNGFVVKYNYLFSAWAFSVDSGLSFIRTLPGIDICVLPDTSVYGISNTFNGTRLNCWKNGVIDSSRSYTVNNYSAERVLFTSKNVVQMLDTGGKVIRSVNAGKTWKPIYTSATNRITDMDFLNDSIGFIAFQNGILMQTEDGGESWETRTIGTDKKIVNVSIFNSSNIVVLDEVPNIIFSNDGGETWNKQKVTGFPLQYLQDQQAYFAADSLIYVMGHDFDFGYLYKYDTRADAGVYSIVGNVEPLEAYPNPNNGSFNLSGISGNSYLRGVRFILFNSLGQQVAERQLYSTEVDLNDQKPGVYSFLLHDNEKTYSGKLVIE